jgi:pyridoxamine 5'-phosphate oxidase
VRVRGTIALFADTEADDYWASRPRDSQIASAASPQSHVIVDRAELDARIAAVAARYEGVDIPRPESWGGYRVVPDEVEFWQGRPARTHDRLRYRRADSTWVIERLAP